MIINYDPDDWVTEHYHRTCLFHQKHHSEPYAGCTCSADYSQRRATPEERRANTYRRLSKEVPSLRATLKAKERELESCKPRLGNC